MTRPNLVSLHVAGTALAVCVIVGMSPAFAGPPSVVHADADYDASGYVTPAGMMPPSMYYGGVMPVGFLGGGCDSCDSYGGGCASCGSSCGSVGAPCGSGCDPNCNGRCGIFSDGGLAQHRPHLKLGSGGVLGKMANGGLRPLCFFCRGGGCSACQMLGPGQLLGALHSLLPYSEAGPCAMRWYDLSAEALFLSHSNGGLNTPVTSQNPFPSPTGSIVMRLGDADGGGDVEAGVRLSASLIFGAGGNIEGTYMGGHEWQSQANAFSNPALSPTLFSFVSDFGNSPGGGFAQTDQSIVQSVTSDSKFHSGELNYRRRTMGPYCRFQGSWLVGLRYVRFDNGLLYSTFVDPANFFASDDQIKNNLFGAQAGFDLWWNMTAGVNLGIGMKAAWVQNDIDRRTTLGDPRTVTAVLDTEHDTTVMGEFEAKLVYRLSHSWSFRSAYYAIAVDDIAFATADRQTIRDFLLTPVVRDPAYQFHSLVVQGFSFGAEYMW